MYPIAFSASVHFKFKITFDVIYMYVFWGFTTYIIFQLRQEKVELEQTLEKEQEYQVNKLMRKIERLEADTLSKQTTLEQVIAFASYLPSPQFPECIFTTRIRRYVFQSCLHRESPYPMTLETYPVMQWYSYLQEPARKATLCLRLSNISWVIM